MAPSKRLSYSEDAVQAAVSALKEKKLRFREASEKYNVPKTAVQNRNKGIPSVRTTMSKHKTSSCTPRIFKQSLAAAGTKDAQSCLGKCKSENMEKICPSLLTSSSPYTEDVDKIITEGLKKIGTFSAGVNCSLEKSEPKFPCGRGRGRKRETLDHTKLSLDNIIHTGNDPAAECKGHGTSFVKHVTSEAAGPDADINLDQTTNSLMPSQSQHNSQIQGDLPDLVRSQLYLDDPLHDQKKTIVEPSADQSLAKPKPTGSYQIKPIKFSKEKRQSCKSSHIPKKSLLPTSPKRKTMAVKINCHHSVAGLKSKVSSQMKPNGFSQVKRQAYNSSHTSKTSVSSTSLVRRDVTVVSRAQCLDQAAGSWSHKQSPNKEKEHNLISSQLLDNGQFQGSTHFSQRSSLQNKRDKLCEKNDENESLTSVSEVDTLNIGHGDWQLRKSSEREDNKCGLVFSQTSCSIKGEDIALPEMNTVSYNSEKVNDVYFEYCKKLTANTNSGNEAELDLSFSMPIYGLPTTSPDEKEGLGSAEKHIVPEPYDLFSPPGAEKMEKRDRNEAKKKSASPVNQCHVESNNMSDICSKSPCDSPYYTDSEFSTDYEPEFGSQSETEEGFRSNSQECQTKLHFSSQKYYPDDSRFYPNYAVFPTQSEHPLPDQNQNTLNKFKNDFQTNCVPVNVGNPAGFYIFPRQIQFTAEKIDTNQVQKRIDEFVEGCRADISQYIEDILNSPFVPVENVTFTMRASQSYSNHLPRCTTHPLSWHSGAEMREKNSQRKEFCRQWPHLSQWYTNCSEVPVSDTFSFPPQFNPAYPPPPPTGYSDPACTGSRIDAKYPFGHTNPWIHSQGNNDFFPNSHDLEAQQLYPPSSFSNYWYRRMNSPYFNPETITANPLTVRARSQLYQSIAKEDMNKGASNENMCHKKVMPNSLEVSETSAAKKCSQQSSVHARHVVTDDGDSSNMPVAQPPARITTRVSDRRTEHMKQVCVSSFLSPERLSNDWNKPKLMQKSTTPLLPLKKRHALPSSDNVSVCHKKWAVPSPDNFHKKEHKSSTASDISNSFQRKQNSSLSPSGIGNAMNCQPVDGASATARDPYDLHSSGFGTASSLELTSIPLDMNARQLQMESPTMVKDDMKFWELQTPNFHPFRGSDPHYSIRKSKGIKTEKDRRSLGKPTSEGESKAPSTYYYYQRNAESASNHDSPLSSPQEAGSIRCMMWAISLVARSGIYKHKFIDSHCHIDLMYSRMGVTSVPFKEFQEKNAASFPVNYEGCVAVFCNPKTFSSQYPKDQVYQMLGEEEGVWFTFGCHPKNAMEFNESHEIGLRKALQHTKVVALGEIGLDYSGTFGQHAEVQKQVFRLQLDIAIKMNLPLVIHCRDADDDCLEILKEIVPRDHRIHAHCFTRDISVAQRWMNPFPNLFLGLTPLISYRTAFDAINTATYIPLDRLLLETDAPYFIPDAVNNIDVVCSHPGFALFTAEKVAELKWIPVDVVLKACRENTFKMYGI